MPRLLIISCCLIAGALGGSGCLQGFSPFSSKEDTTGVSTEWTGTASSASSGNETYTSTGVSDTTSSPVAECGNKEVEEGEVCDDGDDDDNNGCNDLCQKSVCGACQTARPNILFVMDYSTSTNELFEAEATRFEAIRSSIQNLLTKQQSFYSQRANFALMHFGHDPDPNNAGTTIPADQSGMIDGQKVDFLWYDSKLVPPANAYDVCAGTAFVDALEALPLPGGGSKTGIGTWTKGALDMANALISISRSDHEETPLTPPQYILILITDGKWTNPQGNQTLAPANQDPAIAAQTLWQEQKVPTYVVSLGDAEGESFSDQIAVAGGTVSAIGVADSQGMNDALDFVMEDIYARFSLSKDCASL